MDRIHPMLEEYIRKYKYEYLDHGSTKYGIDFAIIKANNYYMIIFVDYAVRELIIANTMEDLARWCSHSENFTNAIQRIKDKQFHKDLRQSLK